ncbi:MAG: PKD-like domain-containing protein, partial [Bacteroidota bacterium]
VFRVAANPGSTYLWTVPPEFDFNVISPPGDQSLVILDFNTVVPDPGLPLTVFETSADGCPGNISEITIAIDPLPGAPTVIGPAEVCANDLGVTFEIDPATINAGSTYNWTIDPSFGTLIQNNNTNIVVNINNIPSNGTPFNILVTESIGNNCEGAATTFPVEVNDLPDTSPIDARVCSNEPIGVLFTDSGNSLAAASTYNIINVSFDFGLVAAPGNNVTVPVNGVLNNAISNDSFENTSGAALIAAYTIVPISADLCVGAPQIARITIEPEPILSSNLDQTRCSGEVFGGALSVEAGSAPAGSYNIVSVNTSGLMANGANAAVPANNVGFNYLSMDSYINTGNVPVDVIYQVSPVGTTARQCVGDPPIAVTFTVLPQPVGINFNASAVCSGDQFEVELQPLIQNGLASTFSWSASYGPNVTGGLNSGIGNIDETLINTTTTTQIVSYTVTPTSFSGTNDCQGNSFIVQVPVEPSPEANDQTVDVCSILVGGTFAQVDLTTLELAINPGGLPITWYADASLSSPITDPTNHTVNLVFPFAFAEVDDGFCQAVAQVTYNISPSPDVTASVTEPLDCPGFS